MHDQIAGDDPAADRTGGDVQAFRNLGDREESDVVVTMTATTSMTERSPFCVALAGAASTSNRPYWLCVHRSSPASRRAYGPRLVGGFRLDRGKALDPCTQVVRKNKVRRPRLTARRSPDLIASYNDVRPAHAAVQACATV